MCHGVAEERREDDGEESLTVVADQTHDIVVAPVIQSSLRNLWTQELHTHTHTHTRGRELKTRTGIISCCLSLGVWVCQILSSN